MKLKSQDVMGDGFDKNVAEKMPKMRKAEDLAPPAAVDSEPGGFIELPTVDSEIALPPVKSQPPATDTAREERHDVQSLIEDLHTQLLVSSRTKRALEADLGSHQKTINQLAQDNRELRAQVEKLGKELKQIEDAQYESSYLRDENADALERVRDLQQEIRAVNESLVQALHEKEDALGKVQELESRLGENEIVRIKGRLKEREANYYNEENQELRSKLEAALARNAELEKKYDVLKTSFDEVKESLTFLRDSCKMHFYNLSEPSE